MKGSACFRCLAAIHPTAYEKPCGARHHPPYTSCTLRIAQRLNPKDQMSPQALPRAADRPKKRGGRDLVVGIYRLDHPPGRLAGLAAGLLQPLARISHNAHRKRLSVLA